MKHNPITKPAPNLVAVIVLLLLPARATLGQTTNTWTNNASGNFSDAPARDVAPTAGL